MSSKKNNSWYFRWLCKRVEKRQTRTYWELLQYLNDREFFWSVPNDDNRMWDGLQLREIYATTHPNFLPPGDSEQCSVLEMLVALANRMENILSNSTRGDQTPRWFWEMMQNLGLDQFHDQNFFQARDNGAINFILNQFINRTYNPSGQGSLFPLKKTRKNMARTEIWYQMMAYIDENYSD